MNFVDHMTVIVKYIVIGNKHFRSQGVWFVQLVIMLKKIVVLIFNPHPHPPTNFNPF